MNRLRRTMALLCTAALGWEGGVAQAPTAVPLTSEPHHHLVLENSYVRVFRVEVPPRAATLLHRHDHDYVYVALGPAQFINAVQGQPEAPVRLRDGETRFARGGFAHVAKNEADEPFRNFTIELLRTQGKIVGQCVAIAAGAQGNCVAKMGSTGRTRRFDSLVTPEFESDEIEVVLVRLEAKARLRLGRPALSRLLVTLGGTHLMESAAEKRSRKIFPEEAVWLAGGAAGEFTNDAKSPARFLMLIFIDSGAAHAPAPPRR